MKKIPLLTTTTLVSAFLLTGCIGLQLGGGQSSEIKSATLGQQLIDLQKAKDTGAINETDYQAQKAKLLGNK